ncbi:MAG TPA: Flp pilus assembly protein CpaB [Roseiflexaceae bacterium]|nr:Flp pilus assembly protein CpaB [Roseiflexaceae bacterium]HMP39816.1 Flp pilus assembly protein CpaB [Roseiflexaceae bacterium]
MNRRSRSGWILFVLGLVLAIGAGALVYVVLQQQATTAAEEARRAALAEFAPVPTVSMPVAARAINIGTTLSAQDITTRDFPVDLVPSTAITRTEDLEGRIATRAIGAGELFSQSQFSDDSTTGISQQIPQGRVLFTFPIIDLMAQSNLLRDGDRVDLLLTFPVLDLAGEPTGNTTALTLQNIDLFRVLRSGDAEQGAEAPPIALVFSVTPEDAVMLKFIKDIGGTIDFTLRSPLDRDNTFTPPPIDQRELQDRYLR